MAVKSHRSADERALAAFPRMPVSASSSLCKRSRTARTPSRERRVSQVLLPSSQSRGVLLRVFGRDPVSICVRWATFISFVARLYPVLQACGSNPHPRRSSSPSPRPSLSSCSSFSSCWLASTAERGTQRALLVACLPASLCRDCPAHELAQAERRPPAATATLRARPTRASA